MDAKIEKKLEIWQKNLLDMSKRNQLLNFNNTKKGCLFIETPAYSDLYMRLVTNEQTLSFPYLAVSSPAADELDDSSTHENSNQLERETAGEDSGDSAPHKNIPSSEQKESTSQNGLESDMAFNTYVVPGDLETDRDVKATQNVLRNLRSKAKTGIEEQGVNFLYLAFGFLDWGEASFSKDRIHSPLILVPVCLEYENINEPYRLSLHEDEILLNPTLAYKLETNFGLILPAFDSLTDDLETYLDTVEHTVSKTGWHVDRKVALSVFSFMQINMYYDLKKHGESISQNEIVQSLAGVSSVDIPSEIRINDYDHDKMDKPAKTFQILDADSSQQDAIVLSKKGCSFVLQGPPGTGKSQTIANMIAEAMADGKKILFVSEKMAALDVVYKRLASAGLDDFCLILHSKKANKKELLESLRKTMELKPIAVTDSAMYKLHTLEDRREKLNAYCSELHRVIMPLKQTVYEANGIIAKLQEVPNISFALSKDMVCSLTKENLFDLRQKIKDFGTAMLSLEETFGENTWKNCVLTALTHEQRHDIQANLDQIREILPQFIDDTQEYLDDLILDIDPSFMEIPNIVQMLRFCATAQPFPKEWLGDQNIAELTAQARVLQERQNTEIQWKTQLDEAFHPKFYDLSGHELSLKLLSDAKDLQLDFSQQYADPEAVLDHFHDVKNLVHGAIPNLETIQKLCQEISDKLGIGVPKTYTEILALCDFLKNYHTDFKASETWFNTREWTVEGREHSIEKAKSLISSIKNIRDEILQNYEKEILNLDCQAMLTRFKTEYTSVFRALNGGFKNDCNLIRAQCKVPTKKIAYDTAVSLLEQLKQYHALEAELQENESQFQTILGGWYVKEETNFEGLNTCFAAFDTLKAYFHNGIPKAVKEFILQRDNIDQFEQELMDLHACVDSEAITNYRHAVADPSAAVDTQLQLLYKASENIQSIMNILTAVAEVSVKAMPPVGYLHELDLLRQYQALQEDDEKEKERLKEEYSFLFEEFGTDWNRILERLAWTEQFKQYVEKYQLPVSYQCGISAEPRYVMLSGSLADHLETFHDRFEGLANWFSGLFTPEEGVSDFTAKEFLAKATRCRMNLKGLDAWIDFRRAKEACISAGVEQFVNIALEKGLDPSALPDIFLKRFENLWLDQIIPDLPAVEYFRTQEQEKLIEEFKNLDQEQLKIAQGRIRELLIQSLPNVDGITSAKDEVSVLKHELGKQRRIMPIRKLLSKIPTLLPKLKPCMMMSPLSVSMFLQDESYTFDMVIFDEASQVRTENAIGAISRGKQVIIAGDVHQLPPTSFFSAAALSGDDEYDEEDDSQAYESVLDEVSAGVLPRVDLKWHYRSRNESLIAFSNYKIYHGSLVTFPSPTEDNRDEGVEYIYVPDGLYDRSKKRNNPVEAKKVVDLVFEQMREFPKRSIGVIAFSAAQQNCIEDEVNRRRIEHPEFNDFFNEENEEPFFVKNLESVQGDERDTIIFSIGYGKANPLEQLHMSFGPLNNEGGYRRLNVAVTRAKYAVKLVGSILPTDMSITDATPKGVKLLHDYIDYAQHGPDVLKNEITSSDVVNTESPFEDAVYDFLTAHGYRVATQVGCSGYRIDMAVRHPQLNGKFVIGVECDGATYHASRTARERDRLRQSVLESMGWRFVRIWSTDWIKDPISEGKRVLNAVETAIREYGQNRPVIHDPVAEKPVDTYVTEVEVADTKTEQTPFLIYEEIEFTKRTTEAPIPRIASSMDEIIKKQAPIHILLVGKQIAPLYCNTKVTNKVRDGMDFIIQAYGNEKEWERRGDYMWNKGQNFATPRVPKEGDKPRSLDQVAPEELAEAMHVLLMSSFGIEKTALFQLTARTYGFARTTAKMVESLETAFALLCHKYDIADKNGNLSLDT